MSTYEYECMVCGLRLTHRQAMTDEPIRQCPDCSGELKRLISGGTEKTSLSGCRRCPGHMEKTFSLKE
jgi:putative FmdB family regulatory protein